MKLQEIKTILIEKFFNEIKTGVTLEESLILVQAAASLISESAGQKTKNIVEDINPFPIEAQSPTKAFDLFSNGTFNTLIAIDESEILPKIVYIAVKEYRNCMHINCTAGSPVPSETNAGGVKIAMIELKALNEDIKFMLGHK